MELKVRFGKGGVASPVTTAGYVAQAFLGLAFAAVWWLGRTTRDQTSWVFGGVVLALVNFVMLRDLVAWLTSTPAQRDAFRTKLSDAKVAQRSGVLSQPLSKAAMMLVAAVPFAMLAWIFIVHTHLRLLALLPLAGWLYAAIRIASEKRT